VVELSGSEAGQQQAPSKSRRKRELKALQVLAERLATLPRGGVERLGLSERALAAIEETARISDPRALRRQYKRIASLLAREDTGTAETLIAEWDLAKQAAAARHHRAERWRERLIEGGDRALGELLAECPRADRQRLRNLTRAARRDRLLGKTDGARKLFRFLREELGRSARGASG
jgi:ribosome-associated protein